LTPGSAGFNTDWKNRDPGCKFPSKVQPMVVTPHPKFHKSNAVRHATNEFGTVPLQAYIFHTAA